MEYNIVRKWGGLHADLSLVGSDGSVCLVIKGPICLRRKIAVVNANGDELYQIAKTRHLFGRMYCIG